MLEIIVKLLISYLLGSLMGGLVLGKILGGTDLRTVGSESAGATNALRTRGKGFAAGVFLIDILKGLAAVTVVAGFAWPWGTTELMSPLALSAACGVAAVLGHLYPVFFGFRGGKGVATLLGTMLGLSPFILASALVAWVIILLVTGYVGLASIGAGVAAALVAMFWSPGTLSSPITIFCLIMTGLVIYTHRANIQRLREGSEYKFDVWGKFRK
jgi:acyl phosphate:glycerol-3-phosphate acyltransferase